MFPPNALPLPGELLLITDELLAPADFLLHRFLTSNVKESSQSTSIIISVSEDVGRWKAISGRLNIILPSLVETGQITFIDAVPNSATAPDLKALFAQVRAALTLRHNEHQKSLVILDDIASLEWIGVPIEELGRFTRALCALSRQFNAALVIRHHVVTPGEPDDIMKRLLQLCTYHIDVFPLSSGRSGSVSGQVALHFGATVGVPTVAAVPRSAAVQYRLTDTGCTFFDRGTGNGVL